MRSTIGDYPTVRPPASINEENLLGRPCIAPAELVPGRLPKGSMRKYVVSEIAVPVELPVVRLRLEGHANCGEAMQVRLSCNSQSPTMHFKRLYCVEIAADTGLRPWHMGCAEGGAVFNRGQIAILPFEKFDRIP